MLGEQEAPQRGRRSPGAPEPGPAAPSPTLAGSEQCHVLPHQQLQSQALQFISEKLFIKKIKKTKTKNKARLIFEVTYTWLSVSKIIAGTIVL